MRPREVIRQTARLHKIPRDFWINCNCMQYRYHKSKKKYLVITYMFLGYALNYTGGTYEILNLRTKCIVLRCDVTWINKTYG